MSDATQLLLPIDLTPCGPVVEAARERNLMAGIRDKVEAEDMSDAFDLYTPDFES